MAKDLEILIDRADAAALAGHVEELAETLSGLAERLLIMRPFIPDKNNSFEGEKIDIAPVALRGAGAFRRLEPRGPAGGAAPVECDYEPALRFSESRRLGAFRL